MLSHFNWIGLVSTSPITIVILGCSIVTFGIAIERAYYFWKRRGDPAATMGNVKRKLYCGDIKEAIWACNNSLHPVARVALRLLESAKHEKDALEEQMHIALSEQKMLLERNLVVLGTMAVMAPLVGLLGTVWGIMRAFNDIYQMGNANLATVAKPISEALIATAFGLAAAIPAVVAHNFFVSKIRVLDSEMTNFSNDFLNIVKRHFFS